MSGYFSAVLLFSRRGLTRMKLIPVFILMGGTCRFLWRKLIMICLFLMRCYIYLLYIFVTGIPPKS